MAAPPDPPRPDDPPSFGEWVAARAAALHRFTFVLAGRGDEAEELTERALAAAHARWRRLAGSDALEPRLRSDAVRAYLRRRGTGGRRLPSPQEQEWSPLDAAAGTLGHQPRPESAAVWQRCHTLTRRQRAALVLCCYEGLSPPEAAAAMGVRRAAARTALHEALAVAVPRDTVSGDATRATVAAEALREHADLAPQPYAPADGAVARSGALRRRRRAVGVALAAVVAVPTAWGLTAGRETPADEPPAQSAPRLHPSSVDTSGWRWESWGGVQVQVPGTWGYGDLTQWCVPSGPRGPSVDRPRSHGTHAVCSLHHDGRPTYTGGLLLRRAGTGPRLSRADVAPEATTRIHTLGGVTMTVIDIDPSVGSAILTSAQVIRRRDHHGCRPHHPRARPTLSANRSPGGPVSDIGDVTSVSVCRYGIPGWRTPTLISSRRLTGASADDLLAALRAAPVRPPTRPSARCHEPAAEFAVLELWPARGRGPDGPAPVVVRYDGCGRHGVDDGLSARGLTRAVLAPILAPPWAGDLAADVRRVVATR